MNKKKVLPIAVIEIMLLMAVTLPVAFVWPKVLKPLVDSLCLLGISGANPIYVISIVFVLIGIWISILHVWRQGYIYVKLSLSYIILFLCGFVLFLRFIVPQLISPF
jgi:hypothetical protein